MIARILLGVFAVVAGFFLYSWFDPDGAANILNTIRGEEETTTGSILVTEGETTVTTPTTTGSQPSNDVLLINDPEAQELVDQGAVQDGEKLILDKSNTLSQEDSDIAQFFNDLMNDNLETTTTGTTSSSSTTSSTSSASSTSSSNLSRQDIQQIEMLLRNLIQ